MGKRVCIFSAQYLPSSGGVEKYTFHIAQLLGQREVEVTIVTSDMYGVPTYEKQNNVTIYRLPCISLMNNRYPLIKYNKEFREAIKQIFSDRYDLLITNTRFYPLSLFGTCCGGKYADRSIVIEHGTAHLSVQNKVGDLLERIFEHAITYFVKRNCNEFYGVSEACNEWLQHFNIQAKSTLYNAIDLNEIEVLYTTRKASLRQRLNISEECTVIAFTGRILKEKGVFQLVKAFKRVNKEFPNTKLIIAGDGPMMGELKKECGANIHLLGRIPFSEVVLLLKESDIFCLPSDSEGMPTSVLEAAACNNFIITTARGGAKEIIKDEMYGLIIEDNDENTIFEAISKVIPDESYRRVAADNCYDRVKEFFTWDKVVEKIQNELLYEGNTRRKQYGKSSKG